MTNNGENNKLTIINSKNEVQEVICDFERIDFENPATLFTYGADIQSEVSNLFKGCMTAAVTKSSNAELEIDDFEQVSSIDEMLKETKRKRVMKKPLLRVKRGVVEALSKIGFSKEEVVDPDLEAEVAEAYREKIQGLSEKLTLRAQNQYRAFELRRDTITDVIPKLQRMEVMYEVGQNDLREYKEETEKLRTEFNSNPTDDLARIINQRDNMALSITQMLREFMEMMIIYKNEVDQFSSQQTTGAAIMAADKRYIERVAPVLEAQGDLYISNLQQERDIQLLQAGHALVNEIVEKNANITLKNQQSIMGLTSSGVITNKTLETLVRVQEEGVKLYNDGILKLREKTESDLKFLESVNQKIDSRKTMLNPNDNTVGAIEASKDKVKKLGSIK